MRQEQKQDLYNTTGKNMQENNDEVDYSNPDQLITTANECINAWNGYYSGAFVTAKFMRGFQYIDAWTAGERRARGRRATLDFNNLQTIIRSLLSEQREADPQIELMPVNAMVSPKSIAVRTDLLRYISLKSNSKMVYQTAYKDSLDCGFGAMLAVTEYESPDTFNQCVRIRAIPDVLTCGWDVNAQHPNKTDGDMCYYTVVMSVQEFKRRWPDKDPALATAPITANTQSYGYTQNDKTAYVTVYFHKEYFNKTVSQLENGKSYTKEGFKKYASEMQKKRKNLIKMKSKLPPEIFENLFDMTEISPVVNTRQSTDFKIKQSLLTTGEELETDDFPGKLLPLVYVEGFSTINEGRQIPIPFAKAAIDAQRVMNYAGSEIADAMTKARKEQWLITSKQKQGAEDIWGHPENVQGALTFTPDDRVPGAAPIAVQNSPVLSQQYQQYYQQMQNDVRTITGRYADNAGDGNAGDSGKAVIAKQMSGNLTVGVYSDNLLDAIAELGRVQNGMINEIYDTDRDVTVLGKDKKTRMERINYMDEMPSYNADLDEDEYETLNDMTKGEFEVTISAGGSFAAQKQMAFNQTMQLLEASQGQIFPYLADILPQMIDIPQSNEISKRMLNFVVPPAVVAMDKNEPAPPPPPPTIQEKIAIAKEYVQIESIKAQKIKSESDIVNSLSSVIIQKSQQKAEEISSLAEIDKAVISANSAHVSAVEEVTKSLIDANNAKLRRENDMLKSAFGIAV